MTEHLKGKYLLEERIGCGGMAEVFIGRTLGAAGFSRRVAIKRIHRGYSDQAQFRQMFEAEARLSASLRHSNVVSVLDFDEDEAGGLFLVMEYVDGVDLDGLLGTGLLPLPVILFVAGEILRGLAYVHELPHGEGGPLGLVHRDVSPQNVLLSWDGAVQVSDFGIAKARAATLAGASISIKGKPAYMSPEQARGLSFDGRSDVFAVGVMLWEMLCGRTLFHDPEDLAATLAAVMFADAPPPSACAPRPVPADLERLTMQMLRRDREERPDALAALAALAACADYPRSGREALVALLPERLPERAPRRGHRRLPRTELAEARPEPLRAAEGLAHHTPIAAPGGRPRPRHLPAHASIARRARRRPLRSVLLGAVAVGTVVGAMLHLTLRADPSAAQAAPASSSPSSSSSLPAVVEHVGPVAAPPADAPRSASDAAPRDAPQLKQVSPAPLDRASPAARKPRTSSPPPPPAPGGMRIIDLQPEPAASGSASVIGS